MGLAGIFHQAWITRVAGFFATEVVQILNECRFLDDCEIIIRSLGGMGIDYLTRRLLYTRLPVSPRWDSIRRIASRLALEDENRDDAYVKYAKLLCAQAARRQIYFPMAAACLGPTDREDNYEEDFYEYDLMTAAAYTNKTSIIEELGDRPENLRVKVATFGNPYLAAVIGGHQAALDLLYRKLESKGESSYAVRSFLVSSVCIEGPTSMVKDFLPWTDKAFWSTNTSRSELQSGLCTPNLGTFNMLMQMKGNSPNPLLGKDELVWFLNNACSRGWEEIVPHLLRLGAPVNGRSTSMYTPLVRACKGGFESIVLVLLKHGARISTTGHEIGQAAKRGNWGSVRMMLQHGADINRGHPPPIVTAVALEREDIFCELIELGAVLHGDVGTKAVECARSEGLDSMLLLLKEHGVDTSDVTQDYSQ